MMTSGGCAHSIAELLGTAGGETPQLTEQHLKLIRGESPEADYEFTPESVAGECSLVVGGSNVPVECNRDHAGSPVLTLAKHRCLDAWASAWHENPRLVPFDFASGMVGGNSAPCPIVEIHNRADGDCLLHALGFYLCVSRPAWKGTVDDLRRTLLDHIEGRLALPKFKGDTKKALETRYTSAQDALWAEKGGGDAAAKYVFVHRTKYAELGELEMDAFARVYKATVCVWSTIEDEAGVMMTYRTSARPDFLPVNEIQNFGTCVHIRHYPGKKHFTLLALLHPGSTRTALASGSSGSFGSFGPAGRPLRPYA